jgi:F420-dependent oxidoreductase-like protein
MLELPSPCLMVLVGPPASGKSTWATTHFGPQTVSADRLRALVGDGEDDLRASPDAFRLLDDVVRTRLRRGLTTVVDSLGTDSARRADWRELAAAAGQPCVAIVFDPPAAQIRRLNRSRAKRVPERVLRTQLAQWPDVKAAVAAEGFDAVHVVQPEPDAAVLVSPTVRSAVAASRDAAPLDVASPDAAALDPVGVAFGLQIPRYADLGPPGALGARLRAVARRAEQVGFDSLWVMDHFLQIPQVGPRWEDMLESWTTLAHLAAVTERVRIGPLVTGITYRNVAHLGKIAATLDVLSGGRATCGLGIGWFEDEHRAYGFRFPPRSDRYALLADAIPLLRQMWGPGAAPFDGRVLHVADTTCYPRPLQARLPILVGGSGERRTLRLVAEHADACNLFGEPDAIAHKVDVLRRHCTDVGRDPAEIAVTHLGRVLVGTDHAEVAGLVEQHRPRRVAAERFARRVHAGTVDQHVHRVRRYVEAGVDEVIVSLVGLDEAAIDRYGAVIAAARDAAPAG